MTLMKKMKPLRRQALQPGVERPGQRLREQGLVFPVAERRSENAGQLAAVFRLVAKRAGTIQRAQDGGELLSAGLHKVLGRQQYFFRVSVGDGLAGRRAPAGAVQDGGGVPRLARAIAVEQSRRQGAGHLRRRQHDDAHVFPRIDPARRQPLPQQDVMGGPKGHHAEGEQLLRRAADQLQQRTRIMRATVVQIPAQGDGVAVRVEDKGREAAAVVAAHAEPQGERQPARRVGGVQLVVEDFFADRPPANFPVQFHRDTLLLKVTELIRGHQRRGIHQRHKTDSHRADDTEAGLAGRGHGEAFHASM